jgi:hypothetical protein
MTLFCHTSKGSLRLLWPGGRLVDTAITPSWCLCFLLKRCLWLFRYHVRVVGGEVVGIGAIAALSCSDKDGSGGRAPSKLSLTHSQVRWLEEAVRLTRQSRTDLQVFSSIGRLRVFATPPHHSLIIECRRLFICTISYAIHTKDTCFFRCNCDYW